MAKKVTMAAMRSGVADGDKSKVRGSGGSMPNKLTISIALKKKKGKKGGK